MLGRPSNWNFFPVFIFFYFLMWISFYVNTTFVEPLFFVFVDVIILVLLLLYVIRFRLFFRFDLIFYILFPFYFKFSFFLDYYFGINLFALDLSVTISAYVFCQIAWIFGIFISTLRLKIFTFSDYSNRFSSYITESRLFNNIYVPFFFALFSSFFFLYQAKDVLSFGGHSYSRLEITQMVGYSGWYLKYIIIAYSWIFLIFFLKNKNEISRTALLILFVPVFLYIFFQQSIGGRREIVFMLLFCLAIYILFVKGRFSNSFYFTVVFLFILLISAGALRDFGQNDFVKIATDSLGEFIFPISTFQVYYSESDFDFRGGFTYFYSITNFIPSSIFEDKPLPLATEFALKVADPNQEHVLGYAITPITEAYINFGLAAMFVFPLLLSVICIFLELLSRYIIFLPVILFSQSLNFQRSDIASTFFETLILVVVFYVFIFFTRSKVFLSR